MPLSPQSMVLLELASNVGQQNEGVLSWAVSELASDVARRKGAAELECVLAQRDQAGRCALSLRAPRAELATTMRSMAGGGIVAESSKSFDSRSNDDDEDSSVFFVGGVVGATVIAAVIAVFIDEMNTNESATASTSGKGSIMCAGEEQEVASEAMPACYFVTENVHI